MNKLQEIVIRWGMHQVGLHTDIQKMYNCVRLKESDWCFQRYVWQEELDITKIPEEKVIMTHLWCKIKWQPLRTKHTRNCKSFEGRISSSQ